MVWTCFGFLFQRSEVCFSHLACGKYIFNMCLCYFLCVIKKSLNPEYLKMVVWWLFWCADFVLSVCLWCCVGVSCLRKVTSAKVKFVVRFCVQHSVLADTSFAFRIFKVFSQLDYWKNYEHNLVKFCGGIRQLAWPVEKLFRFSGKPVFSCIFDKRCWFFATERLSLNL